MNYNLLKETVDLIEQFEEECQKTNKYSEDSKGLRKYIIDQFESEIVAEPSWEGKEEGRNPESVISTLIVHMNRYAKTYSKSAIHDSEFSTQEEFIYLINLKAFGAMIKMELIKRNIHDKPLGMQIINRLIHQGWVEQKNSEKDKRSKVISITAEGLRVLEDQMQKIRQASQIVTGDLVHKEKMELIRLLQKLAQFHQSIYNQNIDVADLLDSVSENYPYVDN
ncbi:winged helix DNA-binding protein [Sphingobacterium faecium]|uniref:MarR family winged helix-turn-helix transcriptional regulator n=1 Tax=Sphingobacterium faecium TaxID=34087 RepID=UPI0012925861|nr:MarR family winged helix-turn-helix transcriptional regulator [Sphingobacterium faecium]MQP27793.1 winged helix DNA-binding protein [Sphingobacterium faecium]